MSNPQVPTTNTKLEIAGYRALPIPTGLFGLDGGAMFGTVPKVMWEKAIPPDAQNRIPMEARALLLRSAGGNILIDTGNGGDFIQKYGEKLGPKFATMYNIDPSGPSLANSLKSHGLSFDDIDHVILTHLHFDHAGGGTKWENGKLVPTFPKAKYYVQRRNLETARKPNLREKASYFPANFEPLIEAGVLEILDGDRENLLPGVSVFVSDGHTVGQQIVRLQGAEGTLMYAGDVVPTSAHVRLAWLMGYDLQPVVLMEEKMKFMGPLADGKGMIFFEHDPYCEVGVIARSGNDFAVSERLNLA